MYAESANNPVAKPSLPARLPVAAALIWCGAFLASAAPWLGQLNPGALIAAFWTFEGSDYASVLAHYSWAPGSPLRSSLALVLVSPARLPNRSLVTLSPPPQPWAWRQAASSV